MIYKPPFFAMTKALNSALAEGNLEWFDSSVPIEEIEGYFKDRAEFEYGIYGTSQVDCQDNKDSVIWDGSLDLEIYSNYKGRKRIAIRLEELLNFLSNDGVDAIGTALLEDGYKLISLTVGAMAINLPMFGEAGVWQSGHTTLTFRLQQIDE